MRPNNINNNNNNINVITVTNFLSIFDFYVVCTLNTVSISEAFNT